jgi:hypothetical protein
MVRIWIRILAAAALSAGCARTLTFGEDPKADPATPASPHPRVYRLALPVSHAVESSMLLEVAKAFDDAYGRELLIVPVPPIPATSEIAWHDAAVDAGHPACVATPSAPVTDPNPAFAMELDVGPWTPLFAQKGHLRDTLLFPLFLHCLGHGVGLRHADAANDVMHEPPSDAPDYDAFYAQLRTLLDGPLPKAVP